MNTRFSMLLALLALVVVAAYFIISAQVSPRIVDDETAIQQAIKEKKTEAVSCTTTVPSYCYLYRCNTGYIYAISLPVPGSNPLRCTDGSPLDSVKEVSSRN